MKVEQKAPTSDEVRLKAVASGSLIVGQTYRLYSQSTEPGSSDKYLGQVKVEVKMHFYSTCRHGIFDMVRVTGSDTADFACQTLYATESTAMVFYEACFMEEQSTAHRECYSFVPTGESLE